ncbi:MAG: hypothetical protein WD492_09885 [Alkalispirochaeta sp.]
MVQSHRPGQIISRNTLRIALGRGIAGRPTEDLLALFSDQQALCEALARDRAMRELAYRREDGRWARRRWSIDERLRGVLDLNNLVWTFRYGASTEVPCVAPLFDLVSYFRSLAVERLIGIADANIAHTVADPELLSQLAPLLDRMRIAPAGVPADELILTAAEDAAPQGGTLIFSNDLFRQWRKSSAWRRRNIWRILVPVRPPGTYEGNSAERQFDLGDPGSELCDPPPGELDRLDG